MEPELAPRSDSNTRCNVSCGGSFSRTTVPIPATIPLRLAWKISPIYSCDQLFKEARAVSVRASALADEKYSRNANITSTEPIIVLPAVLDSTKQMAGEIAVLRGQMQAIEEAAIQSQCDIEFVPSSH
jgi:hypothetical protein